MGVREALNKVGEQTREKLKKTPVGEHIVHPSNPSTPHPGSSRQIRRRRAADLGSATIAVDPTRPIQFRYAPAGRQARPVNEST